MANPRSRGNGSLPAADDPRAESDIDFEAGDALDSVPTSAADVESAGRSCMAILIMGAIILLLIGAWIGLRLAGVGQ